MVLLGKNDYPPGTKFSIQYIWHFGKFQIDTYERKFTVSDSEIKEIQGKYFFNEIEIPASVIEQKHALDLDLELRRGSIESVKTSQGNVYFSIDAEGELIVKLGNKTAVSSKIETVENRRAINIKQLGLAVPYIEVPATVVNAFMKVQNEILMQDCRLVSAGKSLLTGQEYFKFNIEIPVSEWENVEQYFENFGEGSGIKDELTGWVTNEPDTVSRVLNPSLG